MREGDWYTNETFVKSDNVFPLEDGYLLSSSDDLSITAYDNTDMKISNIESLNNIPFQPNALCTNGVDRIYVADYLNDKIIMTDYNLSYITSSIEILNPSDVYFEQLLYICSENNKIYRCNGDFSNMMVFDLDKKPMQIRVKRQKAIVRFEDIIRIYDSDTFTKVHKTINHGGDICLGDEYLIASRKEAFSIYNLNGYLIEYIQEPFPLIGDNSRHGLCICNDTLILTTSTNKIYSLKL